MDRPRLFRLWVRLPDGKRRWALVKCPNYERSPQDSLFGLDAKLAELTLGGQIVGHGVSVPMTITDRQRQRLVRWPEALGRMLA